jgi:peptidoglycan pentaglycine glycine transferase (the first glycine)
MQIRNITDRERWEQFFYRQKDKTFLQSWVWGDLQESMGNTIRRVGVFEGEDLAAAALVIKVCAKRGTFVMVQHAVETGQEAANLLVKEIKKIGKEENADFIRMAPLWEKTKKNQAFVRKLGFQNAPIHISAYEASWKLDITRTEDDLLDAMRKTTRYLIRQTLKNKDISVGKSIEEKDLDAFLSLTREVGKRQQFIPFSEAYIRGEFSAFAKEDNCVLIIGKVKGKVAAAALVVFWSGIGFYHQAASLGEYAKYSVPYLVQWEAIKEAKKRGCIMYDFWGYVDPAVAPKHPWAGPTLFKMGFGGKAFEYIKTQDYPLSWKYWPIFLFERIRVKRRGL